MNIEKQLIEINIEEMVAAHLNNPGKWPANKKPTD
jgi:hypothetical protein